MKVPKYRRMRSSGSERKLLRLREDEGYDPFAHEKWIKKHTIDFVRENFSHLAEDEKGDTEIVTAGRLMIIRRHGKATFADLADETSSMQLYFQVDAMGEEEYAFFKKWVDTGDMLGVVGHPFRTKRGELSILVTRCVLLAKALRPLPEKWHGLKETEIRYRQRYVDLIANPEVRETFRKRAKIVSTFRRVWKTMEAWRRLRHLSSPPLPGLTPDPSRLFITRWV